MEGNPTREILANKRIYTRRNTYPNPPKVVEDPNRILRRCNNKVDKGIFHLQKSLSLRAKGIKNTDDITFGQKFKQSFFRFKSSSELNQLVFDPKSLISSKSAPQPSQASSISIFS